MPNLINDILVNPGKIPFAIIRRDISARDLNNSKTSLSSIREPKTLLEVFTGKTISVSKLDDIPKPLSSNKLRQIILIPYRQITEKGFLCHDDNLPIKILQITESEILSDAEILDQLVSVNNSIKISEIHASETDSEYINLVNAIINKEIGTGEGANFVIRRDFTARASTPHYQTALGILKQLLTMETKAYWNYVYSDADFSLVGATPERHVSSINGEVIMNPISGTFRYPKEKTKFKKNLIEFLNDKKEIEELFMVVDEELKMMSTICTNGGQIQGPYLKHMGHLAHTEYLLSGKSNLDARNILKNSMFAPTVMGSPLENAARIIKKYEKTPRGYYAGVIALLEEDATGLLQLDSSIIIRSAFLDNKQKITVSAGATLVRNSIPEQEMLETKAKSAAILNTLTNMQSGKEKSSTIEISQIFSANNIKTLLHQRNKNLSKFWINPQINQINNKLQGKKITIIDAEDTWTAMLAHIFRRLDMQVTTKKWQEVNDVVFPQNHITVFGPGPGDPNNFSEPKIATLKKFINIHLQNCYPFLAICLSHQILASILGFTVKPRLIPDQGVQKEINYFDNTTIVGFYNTFSVYQNSSNPNLLNNKNFLVSLGENNEINAIKSLNTAETKFASIQFHAESILSKNGIKILYQLLTELNSTSE